FILVFLPLVTMSWRILDKRGIKIRPTDKMVAGFVLTAVTMAIMAGSALLVAGPVQKEVLISNGQSTYPFVVRLKQDDSANIRDGEERTIASEAQLKEVNKLIKQVQVVRKAGPVWLDRPAIEQDKETQEYSVRWVNPEDKV